MNDWIHLAGPRKAVEIFGIRLVGVNAENGKKLAFTLIFAATILLLAGALRRGARGLARGPRPPGRGFWAGQALNFARGPGFPGGPILIWFEGPGPPPPG